jgi:hypothetical protein
MPALTSCEAFRRAPEWVAKAEGALCRPVSTPIDDGGEHGLRLG